METKLMFRVMRSKVYLRLYYKGMIKEMTTRVDVTEGKLDGALGYLGRSPEEKAANRRLFKFRAIIEGKIEEAGRLDPNISFDNLISFIEGKQFVSDNDCHLVSLLDKYMDKLRSGRLIMKGKSRVHSENTIVTRNSTVLRIKRAAKVIGDFDFGKYNFATMAVHGGEKRVRKIYNDWIENFIVWLRNENYNDQTIARTVNTLRTVLNYFAESEGLHLGHLIKPLTYATPDYDVYVMSLEQSRWVIGNYRKIKAECKTKQMRDVVEYWVTALILTPRYGDMRKWTSDNLFEKDGKTWIRYNTQKGNVRIEVPVSPMLLDIFLTNIMKHDDHLLPPVKQPAQKMKPIAKKYEIFKNKVRTWRLEGGKRIEEVKEFWEIAHLHRMRATGITNMLEADGKPHEVKAFSGHTKGSKAFNRYVASRDESIVKLSGSLEELMGIEK